MRVLISQLDAPSTTPSGNTEVVYLRYLEAKTFAPLLGKIAQNIIGKDGGNRSSGSSDAGGVSGSNNSGGTYSSNTTAGSSNSGSSGTKEIVTNSTNIQAEPNTNAVIITAPPALMQALKAVIAKLDIRPAQVLVEAIIAEVDESNLT